MGFWVFMLSMDLLIPLVMIVVGCVFEKRPPKEINFLVGYRTVMSMKNKDTWEFAHRHFGKNWRKVGAILLPLSAAAMCFALGKAEDAVGLIGGVVCFAQLAVLIATIFPTERALKEAFDEDGKRRM